MRGEPNRRPVMLIAAGLAVLAVSLGLPKPARAGKLAWLDEVVHEVVKEAEASGKTLARGADEVSVVARGSERLFVHEGEESLEIVRSDPPEAENYAPGQEVAIGLPDEGVQLLVNAAP